MSAGHAAPEKTKSRVDPTWVNDAIGQSIPSPDVLSGVAELALIFHPISKPAVNDLPLVVVARTEIEKVCPFIL